MENERNREESTSLYGFLDGVTPIYILRRQRSATSSPEFTRGVSETKEKKKRLSAPLHIFMDDLNFVYARNARTWWHLQTPGGIVFYMYYRIFKIL